MNFKFIKKPQIVDTEITPEVEKINGIMNESYEDDILTIYLSGNIDAFNFEEIQNNVFSLLEEKKPLTLVFDMNEVSYVSSAGLRMFSAINQKAIMLGSAYKLTKMREDIMKMFQMTGYASAFCIEMKKD